MKVKDYIEMEKFTIKRRKFQLLPVPKYRFILEIDQNGSVTVLDKNGNSIPPISDPVDVNTLTMVSVIMGIPKIVDGSCTETVIVDDNGEETEAGGCTAPCRPGIVNGQPGCVCP